VVHTTEDEVDSVILADHIRCVDWQVRGAKLIDRIAADVLDEVVAKIEALIVVPGQ
jgi:mRNA-degrading endonuclease toxin of MazEF toxin-antitoxin module